MTEIIFWANTTSSTANASTLISGSDAAIQLTFTNDDPNIAGADTFGDLILESTAGAADPDTWVIINGVTYSFTYDLVGNFPEGNKVPEVLWGKQVAVIITPVGNFYFVLDGSGSELLMNDTGPGRITLDPVDETPPDEPICFCAGTEIATPSGARLVENIVVGDFVLNEAGAAKQVFWVGRTRVTAEELRANPDLRPIRIPAGSIAPKCPDADLDVSPQHRVVLGGPDAELLFGTSRVLVPAKHLLGTYAEALNPDAEVEYFHLLLEGHEILVSNGLPSESFQPARRTIDCMSEASQKVLLATLDVLGLEDMLRRQDCLLSLKSHEAAALLDAMSTRRPNPAGTSEMKYLPPGSPTDLSAPGP